ncbi:MAG: hypothetical protein MKZ76_10960, partial [Pedosphaera sp.]|nr:hypothetical protein [Pedosphaera sp.]
CPGWAASIILYIGMTQHHPLLPKSCILRHETAIVGIINNNVRMFENKLAFSPEAPETPIIKPITIDTIM